MAQQLPGNFGGAIVPRLNAHVRNTIPYNDNSATARDARAFLARMRVVRMRQDSCPGSGHFAAGRSALDGLIRLGFTGTIEVIHTEDADSLNSMALCYSGWRQGGSHIDVVGPRGNQVRVEYLAIPNVHNLGMMQAMQATRLFFQQRPLVPLGIFGASDGYGAANDPADGSPAGDLHTRCGVVLQPFAWPNIRMIEDLRPAMHPPLRRKILQNAQGALASYLVDVPDPLARLPFFRRNQGGFTLAFKDYADTHAPALNANVKKTVVATLAKAASAGCYLMPIYGLHANYPGTWTIDTIVRAIADLNTYQMINGPVVIFNIRGGYDATDHRTLALCTHLQADHPATADTIARAQNGIFVVRAAGGLPNELFQQMAANASLPMLLEGANTANLCIQLGIPYFAVSNNPSIPTVDENNRRGHLTLRNLTNFLWGANRARDDQVADLVAAFMEIMMGGELANYFTRLHQYARANDQLEYALSLLEYQVATNGPPLVAPPLAPVLVQAQPIQQPVPQVQPVQQPVRDPLSGVIHRCPGPRCNITHIGPGVCRKCGKALRPT